MGFRKFFVLSTLKVRASSSYRVSRLSCIFHLQQIANFIPSIIEHVNGMEWINTSNGNRISKDATLLGAEKIYLKGNTTVQKLAIINGDVDVSNETNLAINIGKYCYIGFKTKIMPPLLVPGDTYSPMKIGSYVIIGDNCVINAAAIGTRVVVEDDCNLGDLCVIYDCCIIRKGTIIPSKMVVPPFSEVSGVPGKDFKVKELANGYKKAIEIEAKELQILGRPITK